MSHGRAGNASMARRQGRALADRAADPLCPQRPHPQRGAGRSDRGLDPRVGLDQSGAGRGGRHDHRRPWPGAGGPQAAHDRGAGHGRDRLERGAEAGLRDRRQQARAECRLGRGAAGARARRAGGARLRPRPDRLLARPRSRRSGAHGHAGPDRSGRRAGAARRAGVASRRSLAARPPSAAVRRQHVGSRCRSRCSAR